MADFFVRDKFGERGPFTRSQLRSMWDGGFATSDSEAKMEGTANWLPMRTLFGQTDDSTIQTDVPSVPTRDRTKDASVIQTEEPSVPAKTRTKPWSLLVTVPLLFAVVIGNVHVITGRGVGVRVVMRESF